MGQGIARVGRERLGQPRREIAGVLIVGGDPAAQNAAIRLVLDQFDRGRDGGNASALAVLATAAAANRKGR